MKIPILHILAAVTLSDCSSHSPSSAGIALSSKSRDTTTANLRTKLKALSVADGISKSEANLIAECYFHQNIGCGSYSGIREGNGVWIVDGSFGYCARPIQGFYIKKNTGKITSPIGPSYKNPYEIIP